MTSSSSLPRMSDNRSSFPSQSTLSGSSIDSSVPTGALAYVHQYLVFDAARRVGRELDVLVGTESVDCLDKPDRAYRNQILDTGSGVLELLRYVYDQTQIVLDQTAARVSLGAHISEPLDHPRLLLSRQRRRQSHRTIYVKYAAWFYPAHQS